MVINSFQAPWWCRNPHLQTVWPRLWRYRPALHYRREQLELPDGDFIDIDWLPGGNGPCLLLVHGLEGSSRSPYALGILNAIAAMGWRGAAMNLRGCSGRSNRLARAYHSGDTQDIGFVVDHMAKQCAGAPLLLTGISIGGNLVLKYLGESASRTPVQAAVAVSVPFDLGAAVDVMHHSFGGLYEQYFMHSLRRKVRDKAGIIKLPLDTEHALAARTIREFDDRVTAPLHGFENAAHYYAESSCKHFIKSVRVPTLILHARDDPFMNADIIPAADQLSAATRLEVLDRGGHVGFVSSRKDLPGHGSGYWLEYAIPRWLEYQLSSSDPVASHLAQFNSA